MLSDFGWVPDEHVVVIVERVYINSGSGWTFMEETTASSTASQSLAKINLTSEHTASIQISMGNYEVFDIVLNYAEHFTQHSLVCVFAIII